MIFPFVANAQLEYLQNIEKLPTHPRILLLANEEQLIKNNISSNADWETLHRSIIEECDKIVELPVLERQLTGRRLLSVSREALRRIFYLSYAYRIESDQKYLRRAESEMLAISTFSDWNPAHFLDVAEMTMAVAIGYDWLYNDLPQTSREVIKTSILKLGIEPSLNKEYNWFLSASHNWNQVCNAGMSFGALAIYEDMPEFAAMIIDRAIKTIQLSMVEYGPDGAYPEGYSYWDYGTSFNVLFVSLMEKAFGSDFNLSEIPGFMRTAAYMGHMLSPSNLCYNYADCGLGASFSSALFWFAGKLDNPSLLWNERKILRIKRRFTQDRILPAALVWGNALSFDNIQPPDELCWVGTGINPVMLMRTSWTDPKAIYVGFKGGSASTNHAHMDAGSFIMEANGIRWASDFGMQDYNSLESKNVDLWNRSQNSQRWQVFRYNNYTHNTLTIDNQLHRVDGYAPIVSSASTPSFMNAVVDLSNVLEGQLERSKRGVAIIDKQYVVIRDELKSLNKETIIRWTLLTTADAQITGKNSIELTKSGEKLKLEVISPVSVEMKTWSTSPPNDFDAPNPGSILVGFEMKIPADTEMAFSVNLIPQNTKKIRETIPVLSEWINNK
jgi:Heparinase II/III-like protein.